MKSGRVIHHEIHHSFIDPVRKPGRLRNKSGGKHFFHRRIVNMIHINIIVFPGKRNLFVADLSFGGKFETRVSHFTFMPVQYNDKPISVSSVSSSKNGISSL